MGIYGERPWISEEYIGGHDEFLLDVSHVQCTLGVNVSTGLLKKMYHTYTIHFQQRGVDIERKTA